MVMLKGIGDGMKAQCPKCGTPLNPGKMLSDLRTPEQVEAARQGGKKGGRPRKIK